MENIDDDFGDIYSDVEAENGVSGFIRMYVESEAGDKNQDADNERRCFGNVGSSRGLNSLNSEVGVGHPLYSGGALNEKSSATETDGSDSEDDLNIVLNDNDYEVFSSKTDTIVRSGRAVCGSNGGDDHFRLEQDYAGLKSDRYIRPSVAVCSNIAKDNATVEGTSFSPMFARDGVEVNKHNQKKIFSIGQVAGLHFADISKASLSGQTFSLPSYRTILDVNIDSFEQKPWRNPEADVTNFFNFGFDEESWICFCKSLDLIQQQTSRIPVYDLKSCQGYKTQFDSETVIREGADREVVGPETGNIVSCESVFDDREARLPGLPKGRAIHVEDSSNFERLPYVKRRSNRDSNVVIEIVAQDSMEPSSSSQKSEGYHSNVTGYGTSKSGDLDVNGSMNDEDGDDISLESLDRGPGRLKSKRFPPLETESHVLFKNYVESGDDPKYAIDRRHCCQKNISTSFYNAGMMEKVNKKIEEISETSFDAVPSTMEMESSNDDEIEGRQSSALRKSPSYSCFLDDPDKFRCPMKRSLSESVIDNQNSPIPENSLSQNNNSFTVEGHACGRRYHSMGKNNCDFNSFQFLCGRVGSSIIPTKRKTTRHDLGYCDRKHSSNHQEIQTSPYQRGDIFDNNNPQIPCSKKVIGKSHQSYRVEAVPYSQKKWEEQEYYIQKRFTTVDKFLTERNCYGQKNALSVQGTAPHIYREPRHVVSKHPKRRYHFDKEREAWLRKRNGFRSLKRIENNDSFFECRDQADFIHDKERYMWGRNKDDLLFRKGDDNYEYGHSNDYLLDKYRSPIITDRDRHFWAESSERHSNDYLLDKYGSPIITDRDRHFWAESSERHQACTGREYFSRRERCSGMSSLDLGKSVSMQFKDKPQQHDDYRSYIDNPIPNGGKLHNMSIRDKMYDSKSAELYGKSKIQLCSERSKVQFDGSGSVDVYKHRDGIGYSDDDQNEFGKRKYHQTKELSWADNDSICWHQDDNSFSEEAPLYFEKHLKQEINYGKHRWNNEKLFDRYKFKMPGEASGNGRSSDVVFRGKQKPTVLRCRDPVELVVGKGKSCRRSLTRNDYTKFVPEPNDLKAWNKSLVRETDSEDEKWLDKFPVTEYNEDLDVEEGQILESEPDPEPRLDKGIVFGSKEAPECEPQIEETVKKMQDSSDRILEMRLKMEKRGERFKKDDVIVKGATRFPKIPLADSRVENKQRPVRKRRWSGC